MLKTSGYRCKHDNATIKWKKMRGYVTRIEGVCPVCAEKVYVGRMVYLAAVKKLKAEDEAKKSKL